ncbi:hypothetical protein CRUP_012541 [Coryphaenoides rupestris]|nr:hypothetical protein CRUP_012541 [Coryphaenoides rupestris]
MSMWLDDGEVLVGQGSGEASSWSPRSRGLSAGSPRSSPGQRLSSPSAREAMLQQQQEPQTMDKPESCLCFDVFDSLDRQNNGFLTHVEFNMGLGGLMARDDNLDPSLDEGQVQPDPVDWQQDTSTVPFVNMLMELGADRLFKDRWEVSSLWSELQRERPQLLAVLEDVLGHTVAHLQDTSKERDSLEQALLRRESEHNRIVESIYEEMENQLKEEKNKQQSQNQDSIKQWDRGQQLEEDLSMRDQELESSLAKQRELESSVRALSSEQADIKEQKQQLHSLNVQLREQLETTQEELQSAKGQLNLIHFTAAEERQANERNVMKVSRNIQKEKESLLRQLEILRDMNKRLRDETDARKAQKRLSSSTILERNREEISNLPKSCDSSSAEECEHDVQAHVQKQVVRTQRMFKVVFLGSSGVGKTSLIRHYCTGHFSNSLASTVGIDYQMKSIILGSVNVVLQLWDTAGQERYRSITQQYYRKADGILSMYDITDSKSFMAVREWMDCVRERRCEGAVLMLLGNKEDVVDDASRAVTKEEGQKLAEHHQAEFYECSAKSGYNVDTLMSALARSCAYILIATGAIVVVTGVIGCCATLREMRNLLVVLDHELRQNLRWTMQHKYRQPGEESITQAVDKLQQEFKCCGSNSSQDWANSVWILASGNDRLVPDSCCKTPMENCGRRDHPSNIFKLEGGCIVRLGEFVLSQLHILGGVGIGIAFLQLLGMMLTCCLYRNLKKEPY